MATTDPNKVKPSRVETILMAMLGESVEIDEPKSRVEELLLQLKEAIEQGGGTGGTTNYNDLSNKPQINGNTLSGNKTGAQLGLASASDIPTTLAELTDDATHRVVSDTEKSTWNSKQTALDSTQLAAVNSGITSADVAQITTNKNNILTLQQQVGYANTELEGVL